jgi:hypothetical protein
MVLFLPRKLLVEPNVYVDTSAYKASRYPAELAVGIFA